MIKIMITIMISSDSDNEHDDDNDNDNDNDDGCFSLMIEFQLPLLLSLDIIGKKLQLQISRCKIVRLQT